MQIYCILALALKMNFYIHIIILPEDKQHNKAKSACGLETNT